MNAQRMATEALTGAVQPFLSQIMQAGVCAQVLVFLHQVINTFPAAPKIAISPPLRELAANLLRNDLLKSKKAL